MGPRRGDLSLHDNGRKPPPFLLIALSAAGVLACASCRRYGPGENPLGGCGICHADVEDEVAGGGHLAAGIGCVKCHGTSAGHVGDENNEVKPDRVFTKDEIDPFCGGCHPCRRPREKPRAERRVCTACHGAH